MLSFLAAPFLVSALLLMAGGGHKLLRPAPTRDLFRALALPLSGALATVLAALEIAVGGLAVFHPSPRSSAALALLYSALTLFLIYLRSSHPERSCACLGASHSPASAVHILLNAVAVAVAAAVTAAGGLDLYKQIDDISWALPVYVAGLSAASWLVYLIVLWLPRAFTHVRARLPHSLA